MASFLLSLAASALSKLGEGRSIVEDDISAVHNSSQNYNNNDDARNDRNVTSSENSVKGNIYTKAKSIEMRQRYICGANKLFFRERPLKIVRGTMKTIQTAKQCIDGSMI